MRISPSSKATGKWLLARLFCLHTARVTGLVLLLAASLPLSAESEPLSPGASYDLELENGSILKGAVFRERKAQADYFELPGVVDRLKIQRYRIMKPDRSRPWQATAGIAAITPLDGQALGFNAGLQFELLGAVSLLPAAQPLMPQLAGRAGFARLSGSRAILSGPEIAAGPLWQIAFDQGQKHNLRSLLMAGSGFYELLNRNIESTFAQTTFIAAGQIGYLYRTGHWGYALSYTHTWFFDTNYPMHAGGLSLAATYFSEDI